MKIIIKNQDLRTIEITIETPYELRALYILVTLVAIPEFGKLVYMVDAFRDIPGLQRYSQTHIQQNPIEKIFNLLTGNNHEKTPTVGEKKAIIKASLEAIKTYNQQLDEFLGSEFFERSDLTYYALRLFFNAASRETPLSKNDFLCSQYVTKVTKDIAKREALFDLYKRYETLLKGFPNIDHHYASNMPGIITNLVRLSQTIQADDNVQHLRVDISGITPSWRDTHVSPGLLGSVVGVFAGSAMTISKAVYDAHLPSNHDADNTDTLLPRLLFAQAYSIITVFSIMGLNSWIVKRKEKYDNAIKDEITELLADKIFEYKLLLQEKGYSYQKSSVKIENLPEEEQPLCPQYSESAVFTV